MKHYTAVEVADYLAWLADGSYIDPLDAQVAVHATGHLLTVTLRHHDLLTDMVGDPQTFSVAIQPDARFNPDDLDIEEF